MKIEYSQDADALYITLKENDIAESDEVTDDIIMDYDENGNVVGIEILWASEKADISQLLISCFDKEVVKVA